MTESQQISTMFANFNSQISLLEESKNYSNIFFKIIEIKEFKKFQKELKIAKFRLQECYEECMNLNDVS